jgi:hypothetical protein
MQQHVFLMVGAIVTEGIIKTASMTLRNAGGHVKGLEHQV